MYLLIDFSNAARKVYTQLKKAELLGGLGKVVGKTEDTSTILELKKQRQAIADKLKALGKPSDKERKSKAYMARDKKNLIYDLQEVTQDINYKRKTAARNNPNTVSYTDAAQKARRGKTTPIKSKSYIDRSSYIQNPQDNTVLAATLNKVDKNTRKDGVEYGTTLYKDKNRLKASSLVKGESDGVYNLSSLPKGKEAIIDIHSHPVLGKERFGRMASVIPSKEDLSQARSKKSLIVSPQAGNKRTITAFKPTDSKLNVDKDFKNYRKKVREAGGDYTVLTPNKNQ